MSGKEFWLQKNSIENMTLEEESKENEEEVIEGLGAIDIGDVEEEAKEGDEEDAGALYDKDLFAGEDLDEDEEVDFD